MMKHFLLLILAIACVHSRNYNYTIVDINTTCPVTCNRLTSSCVILSSVYANHTLCISDTLLTPQSRTSGSININIDRCSGSFAPKCSDDSNDKIGCINITLPNICGNSLVITNSTGFNNTANCTTDNNKLISGSYCGRCQSNVQCSDSSCINKNVNGTITSTCSTGDRCGTSASGYQFLVGTCSCTDGCCYTGFAYSAVCGSQTVLSFGSTFQLDFAVPGEMYDILWGPRVIMTFILAIILFFMI